MAAVAYHDMCRENRDQCCVISGILYTYIIMHRSFHIQRFDACGVFKETRYVGRGIFDKQMFGINGAFLRKAS